jgi:hypothetical protein
LQDPRNPEPTDLRALPDFSGSVKRKPRNQARRDEAATEEEENS